MGGKKTKHDQTRAHGRKPGSRSKASWPSRSGELGTEKGRYRDITWQDPEWGEEMRVLPRAAEQVKINHTDFQFWQAFSVKMKQQFYLFVNFCCCCCTQPEISLSQALTFFPWKSTIFRMQWMSLLFFFYCFVLFPVADACICLIKYIYIYVFFNVLLNSWLKSSKNPVLPPGFLVLRLNHYITRACLNAQFNVFY